MASVTLTTLRSRVRERADMVGSTFVTDAGTSLDAFINSACDELYDLLVTKFQDYFTTSATVSLTAGTDTYALPPTYFKTLGVDILDGSIYRSLQKFEFAERNQYAGVNANPLTRMRYQARGSNLVFHPAPAVSGTAKHWFIPLRTQMSAESDTFDPISDGWVEFVVVAAAIRCLAKEESDVSALMAEKGELKRRIEEAAANRDVGGPARVVDVDSTTSLYPWQDYQRGGF
jgi:hypothetical protein